MENLSKDEKTFDVLCKQRSFFMAVALNLMTKDFEDREATILQISVAKLFLDTIEQEGHMLNDESEGVFLKAIMAKLNREIALEEIRKALQSPPDPF